MAECDYCGREIHWLTTSKNNKRIPVDPPVAAGAKFFVPGTHIAHFTTCEKADEARQDAKNKREQRSGASHQQDLVFPPEYEEWRRDMMAIGKLKDDA